MCINRFILVCLMNKKLKSLIINFCLDFEDGLFFLAHYLPLRLTNIDFCPEDTIMFWTV